MRVFDLVAYSLAAACIPLILGFARLIGAWDGTTADIAPWWKKLTVGLFAVGLGLCLLWILGDPK